MRNRIWTYPPDAIAGPTLFSIPLEEVFFFVIQTYNTALLYVVVTKHLVLPVHLLHPPRTHLAAAGCLIITGLFFFATACVHSRGRYTYLGLILAWATPFVLLLW